MRKSILIFAITLSLTKLSFAASVPEQWCFKCPPGSDLTLIERDRYNCMAPGANHSSGAPLWAKPSWAKVMWDVQKGRCIKGYIRFGDEFCFQCPGDYQLRTAVTEYRKEKGNSCQRIIGRWEWDSVPGEFMEFYENKKVKFSDGAGGTWQCNGDGSITLIQQPSAKQRRPVNITITISHDGSSFSGQLQGVALNATRVQ